MADPLLQTPKALPGARVGRGGAHILSRSPQEWGTVHAERAEPHPGLFFSPLRSLLPPEPCGAGDPSDL